MSDELEMVCVCDVEGVEEVEARRLAIFRRMNLSDMRDLTEAIIMSLAFDFQAVAEVYADQWFGVSLRTPLVDEGLFVQCDHPADGLAALWMYMAGAFPERVTSKQPWPPSLRVTERVSAALLKHYKNARTAYDQHCKANHPGSDYSPPCEDCTALLTLYAKAHHTLDDAWGARTLDPAIERAFAE